jgi:3-oxoacyl-[acyl-carrier protein] reductase
MDFQLEGRRALVMGASAGLGYAVAQALVNEKATVAICSRSEERIQAAAKKIGAPLAIAADLSSPEASRALVQNVVQKLGGLDILVCNTGGPPKGSFFDLTSAQWQQGFQSLWLSAVEAMKEAIPPMRARQWGRVILITSVAAKEPMHHLTVSNGLRAGLSGLVKSVSNEVAGDGVTINAVLPGYTDTERLRELAVPPEKIATQIPARRLGRPEELGAVVAFLASVQASYVTGQAIAVDGGWLHGI